MRLKIASLNLWHSRVPMPTVSSSGQVTDLRHSDTDLGLSGAFSGPRKTACCESGNLLEAL